MTSLLAAILIQGQSENVDTLFPAGGLWRYVDTYDARQAQKSTLGFNSPKFDDTDWWVGRAPFGNVLTDGEAPRTQWDTRYPAKVRTWVDLRHDYQSIELRISVDNGFTLFFDGNYVTHEVKEGPGKKWEHVIQLQNVKRGKHLVSLLLVDWHHETWFDCEIVGRRAR